MLHLFLSSNESWRGESPQAVKNSGNKKKSLGNEKKILMNVCDEQSQVLRRKNVAEFSGIPAVVRVVCCAPLFLFDVLFQRDMCLFLCMSCQMNFEQPFPFAEPLFKLSAAGLN